MMLSMDPQDSGDLTAKVKIYDGKMITKERYEQ